MPAGLVSEWLLCGQVSQLEAALLQQLVPRDAADDRDVILEVRAGTGGEEAGLFAGELFRMYTRFAQQQRWRFEPIEVGVLLQMLRSDHFGSSISPDVSSGNSNPLYLCISTIRGMPRDAISGRMTQNSITGKIESQCYSTHAWAGLAHGHEAECRSRLCRLQSPACLEVTSWRALQLLVRGCTAA